MRSILVVGDEPAAHSRSPWRARRPPPGHQVSRAGSGRIVLTGRRATPASLCTTSSPNPPPPVCP